MKPNLFTKAAFIAFAASGLSASSGRLAAQTLPKYEIISLGGATYPGNVAVNTVAGNWYAIKTDRGKNTLSTCTTQFVRTNPPGGLVFSGTCKVWQGFTGNTATSTFAGALASATIMVVYATCLFQVLQMI